MVTYNRSLYFPKGVRPGDFLPLRSASPYVGPLARRRMAQGILYQQTAEGLRSISTLSTIGIGDIVVQAAAGMTGDLAEAIQAFAKALKYKADRKAGMLTVHETIGAKAQRAILASYDAARAFSPPSYRLGDRYAGGKLRDAIADPSFYIPQPDALLFINKGILDQKAKQWYRLNFGAGLAGGGARSQDFPLVFGEQSSGLKIGLSQFGPSAPFDMPAGVFGNLVAFAPRESESERRRGGGLAHSASISIKHRGTKVNLHDEMQFRGSELRNLTQGRENQANEAERIGGGTYRNNESFAFKTAHRDPFTPLNQLPPGYQRPRKGFVAAAIPTYGIHPERFFDAGIRSIAQTLPVAYLRLAREWFEDAVEAGKGPASKSGANAGHLAALVRRGV